MDCSPIPLAEKSWRSGLEGAIGTEAYRSSAKRRTDDCRPTDMRVDHSAACIPHLCCVSCDRPPRAVSHCAESCPLFRGRITVRTRFGRTLPVAREVSLGMASPADHDLALQAERTSVARAGLPGAPVLGRVHRPSTASLHLVYSVVHS